MLVLSRKLTESVRMLTSDGIIDVHVVDVQGDKVRLAFNAPRIVNIARGELLPMIPEVLGFRKPAPTDGLQPVA